MIILGAGGHAKQVIASVLDAGGKVTAVYDDTPEKVGTTILGIPILGPISEAPSGSDAIIAIGNNSVRQKLAAELDMNWQTTIHPSAWVHESVEIGEGSVIVAGVIVQPDVKIGRHVIISTSSAIAHDCVIEDFAFLAMRVSLAGGVHICPSAFIGVSAAVIPGVTIGEGSIVAGGAVVIKDLPPKVMAAGIPAAVKRSL